MKAGWAAAACLALAPLMPAQRFSVSVDAVRVDALVTNGNRPVPGLAATDFELRDSGVLQRIDALALEDVPLNVMLALDTSGSVKGAPLANLKQAATAVVGLLSPDDRAALLTFSGALTLQAEWTSDHARLDAAIASTEATGGTALHDAAYAAITLRDDRPGRSLVLIFSDGDDTSGWLSGQAAIEIGRRNDAVVYAVGLRGASRVPDYRVDFRSGLQPDVPNVLRMTLNEQFLNTLAVETGGKYIDAQRSDQLRDSFVRIVKEFRSRYLLTYSPRGVDAGGWHPIDVRLKGKQGKITARRGYLR